MKTAGLLCIMVYLLDWRVSAFLLRPVFLSKQGVVCKINSSTQLAMMAKNGLKKGGKNSRKSKGGASGSPVGFGSSPNRKDEKDTAGGKSQSAGASPSTPPSLKVGVVEQTEQAIQDFMSRLKKSRPHVWQAVELRKKLALWQTQIAGLSVLQQAELPPGQVRTMQKVEDDLKLLQAKHGITDLELHNIFQEATWDASARVKDRRQATTQIPIAMLQHMEAVVTCSGVGPDSRVMDVGCGTGILMRFLEPKGVQQADYVGVDLSSQMVEVASERYPGATFTQGDFLAFEDDQSGDGFSHVFFNGCLHNILDPGAALEGAARLLRKGGRIVISHPKGAANVDKQRRANPILVPNRLPSAKDLERVCAALPGLTSVGMHVVSDTQHRGEGYLEILQRDK